MAGYIGTKAALLSTTTASVGGDSTVGGDLTVDTNTLHVDSANNRVGVGTSSPNNPLTVVTDSAANGINIVGRSSDDRAYIYFSENDGNTFTGSIHTIPSANRFNFNAYAGNNMTFSVDGAEKMRIDSSGNLLVGTTDTDPSNDTSGSGGIALGAASYISLARANATPLLVNRIGNDGENIILKKDGSTVGSIGTNGTYAYYASRSCGIQPRASDVIPTNSGGSASDNAIDLGDPSVRFDDVYATNGTIQTSDRNEKQDIAALTATEMLVAARISAMFKTFRWIDKVADNPNARTHTGIIAQDVQQAFADEGLNAGDYSLFISTTWWETQTDVPAVAAVAEVIDDDGNVVTEAVEAKDAYTRTDTYDTQAEAPEGATQRTRMGIRYPELLSFIAAYNEQRFADIEARLTALEAV